MQMPSLAAALAAALVAGCGSSDSEAEIRALFAAAEEAAEARDAGFFGDIVGESYRDSRGSDRAELLRTLRGYFIVNQRIDVVSRIDENVLEGRDAARAVVHAGMLGQRSDAELLAGVNADLYRFEIELVNDDGEWQIIGANWDRALGE
jgi:protein-disulfide isomerase-like protein with CxxC motif